MSGLELFFKRNFFENISTKSIDLDKFNKNTYLHLTRVEKDFLSLKNLFYGFCRVIMRKISRFI